MHEYCLGNRRFWFMKIQRYLFTVDYNSEDLYYSTMRLWFIMEKYYGSILKSMELWLTIQRYMVLYYEFNIKTIGNYDSAQNTYGTIPIEYQALIHL